MEVPFEYLCFLALEKLLKYENKRKIKIEKLLKYIDEIQKSFIKSFNNGEKATREKGLKRNFKFKTLCTRLLVIYVLGKNKYLL